MSSIPVNPLAISPVARVTPRSKATSGIQLLTFFCAFLFTTPYVARVSLLPYAGGNFITFLLDQLQLIALILSFGYVLLGGIGRPVLGGGLILLATATSLWGCDRFGLVLPRWIGWTIMFTAVGPFINTRHARTFRFYAKAFLQKYALAIVVISAIWWGAGLPNLGRGDFTGVMWHSMMLGPIAALVGVYSIVKAVNSGFGRWHGLYVISLGLSLLASSRAALAALLMATIVTFVLKAKKSPLVSILILTITFQVVVMPSVTLACLNSIIPNAFFSGLARKEFAHTREFQWEARWDEFNSSPWFGVGFASAWEDTIGFNDESGVVETGSSYLALLSMTGIFGFGSFLFLAISVAIKTIKSWKYISVTQQMTICAFSSFWAVHFGAEGYIFAVGSLLSMTFWLWLGCLNDQLTLVRRGSKKPLSIQKQQHPRTQMQVFSNNFHSNKLRQGT